MDVKPVSCVLWIRRTASDGLKIINMDEQAVRHRSASSSAPLMLRWSLRGESENGVQVEELSGSKRLRQANTVTQGISHSRILVVAAFEHFTSANRANRRD